MRDREGSREARSAERNTGVGDYQNGRARNLLHLLYSSATAAYSYASIPPLRSTDTPRRLARKPPGASPHDIIAMDYRDTCNATEASYCLRTSLTIRTKRWRELGDERVQRFISSFFFKAHRMETRSRYQSLYYLLSFLIHWRNDYASSRRTSKSSASKTRDRYAELIRYKRD